MLLFDKQRQPKW